MTHNNPTEGPGMTHPPLTTDFNVEWSEVVKELQEGEYLERGFIHLDNGYSVSLLRTNIQREGLVPSIGEPEGLWEVVPVRPTTNFFAKMQGLDYEPAPEFDHLLNYVVSPEEWGIEDTGQPHTPIGKFTDAEVNALATAMAEAPAYEAPAGEESPFAALLEAMLGGEGK